MRSGIVSIVHAGLVWVCLGWPQALLAALPEGLEGAWRGVVEIEGTEAAVQVTLAERGGRFELALTLPEMPALRADFVPSERPRVFEVATAGRGLFGFFDDGDQSSPFDGVPLIWARAGGVGLVAYRLTIDPDGAMALLQVALEPVEEGLRMEIEQRLDAGSPRRFSVLLEPAG